MCWGCFVRRTGDLREKLTGGGTLILQEQLSQDHLGQLLQAEDEKALWFIQRHNRDEPSRWINESMGVMEHESQIFEVYNVDIEETVEEADYVRANDETIAPGYLKKKTKAS